MTSKKTTLVIHLDSGKSVELDDVSMELIELVDQVKASSASLLTFKHGYTVYSFFTAHITHFTMLQIRTNPA